MKYLRWAAAWALYGLGDLASRLFVFDKKWLIRVVFPIYNWSMTKSRDAQGEGDGPWEIIREQSRH